MTKNEISRVVASVLVILSVFLLVLGIAHLFRAGENVYNFVFKSGFSINEYHEEYDGCIAHGFETEQEQHNETAWANLHGNMAFKRTFFCFLARLLNGLFLISIKFIASMVLFWAGISNVNSRCKLAYGGKFTLLALSLNFFALGIIRWLAWLRVLISAIKYSSSLGSFWSFLNMASYSFRLNLYPIILILSAVGCALLFGLFIVNVERLEDEEKRMKKIEEKLKKYDDEFGTEKATSQDSNNEAITKEISIKEPTPPFIEL